MTAQTKGVGRWLALGAFAAPLALAVPSAGQISAQAPAATLSLPTKAAPTVNPAITTPEKFFGFQMGADRKLARWDKLVDYYNQLAKESPRIKVENMGPTDEGNPFLAVYISSPENLARLETLREWNLKLADPRGVPEAEIRRIVSEGKAVVLQSMSMHATEVGGSQMAPELIYDLVARTDPEAQRILDNVVAIMVPSFNPDGQIWVTDFYNKYVGTQYEGANYPSLYTQYAGHDNNRDAFMTNLKQSQYMAKLLFRDWKPQAYVDHHHMGSYGARISLPPYAEPVRPFADPLVWRELGWYGAQMAAKEDEANLTGAIGDAVYSGWGHFGFHWITPFHNIAGMLTESASARLASPLEIPAERLSGGARNLPRYEEQTNFPSPWPGGTWRLRDIVERQKVSAWAALDLPARNKETILENAYLKAKRQTERGEAGPVKAYLVPINQHDPLTTEKMINKLLGQGIEVQRTTQAFTQAGKQYDEGSFVVSMAQPKMGLIRWLLGQTFYPDNSWTREQNGTPIRPYDMSTDAMNEFMGVTADPATTMPGVATEILKANLAPAGTVARGSNGYRIDGKLNDAMRAANMLLDKGIQIRRVDRGGAGAEVGDFTLAASVNPSTLNEIAIATGVDFLPLHSNVNAASHQVVRQRVAMYERYGGGNADQGWTQFILEEFAFPFTNVFDKEIKPGNFKAKYDVLILPYDNVRTLIGAQNMPAGAGGGGFGGGFGGGSTPPEYITGLGDEGVAAIKAFVEQGGTLVTFGASGSFAIERLGVPVRDVTAGKSNREFWSPGSTFHANVVNTNPLAYGMPPQALAVWLMGSQAYEITDPTAGVETIVSYVPSGVLQSGWLDGEAVVAGKSAMVSVPYGKGRIVMIGFRAQHRAQTYGTYKLLFNALMN